MKSFQHLLNESESAKITSDYTRFLIEKQYALTKETVRILLEEDGDDEDGTEGVPFSRTYKGNKIYVNIDVGGRREIKVVDSVKDAKDLAANFDTVVALDSGGNEINLNEDINDVLAWLPNIPGLGSLSDIGRKKAQGAAIGATRTNKYTGQSTVQGIEDINNWLRSQGVFGPGQATRVTTTGDRNKQVEELKAKLDKYEMEVRSKGYKRAEDVPYTPEEETLIAKVTTRSKEPKAPSLPSEDIEQQQLSSLPKIQLKAYQDYLKTATEYQGKNLKDYYDANPDKFEMHEPYMENEIAARLMPFTVSDRRGSSMPKGLEQSVADSAAKVIETTPEMSVIAAAAVATPQVASAVSKRIVGAAVNPETVKSATKLGIESLFAAQGAKDVVSGTDVVQKGLGAAMVAPIAGAASRAVASSQIGNMNVLMPREYLNSANYINQILRAGQRRAANWAEMRPMISREVRAGQKEGKIGEWSGVDTTPERAPTKGQSAAKGREALEVEKEAVPELLARAWEGEKFSPEDIRRIASERTTETLRSDEPAAVRERQRAKIEFPSIEDVLNPKNKPLQIPLLPAELGNKPSEGKETADFIDKLKERGKAAGLIAAVTASTIPEPALASMLKPEVPAAKVAEVSPMADVRTVERLTTAQEKPSGILRDAQTKAEAPKPTSKDVESFVRDTFRYQGPEAPKDAVSVTTGAVPASRPLEAPRSVPDVQAFVQDIFRHQGPERQKDVVSVTTGAVPASRPVQPPRSVPDIEAFVRDTFRHQGPEAPKDAVRVTTGAVPASRPLEAPRSVPDIEAFVRDTFRHQGMEAPSQQRAPESLSNRPIQADSRVTGEQTKDTQGERSQTERAPDESSKETQREREQEKKVDTESSEKKTETKAPDIISGAPVVAAPAITKIIDLITRRQFTGDTGKKGGGGEGNENLDKPKRERPNKGSGAGLPIPGAGEGGGGPAEIDNVTRQMGGPENWDLLLKQLYGKQAATLSK
jgi:hypothetical protein